MNKEMREGKITKYSVRAYIMERYRYAVIQMRGVSVGVRILVVYRNVGRVSWSKGHPTRGEVTESEPSGTEKNENSTRGKKGRWDIPQDSRVISN